MRASLDRLYEADFELEGYKAQAAGVAGSSIQQSEGESDSLAVFAGQSATRASTISPTSAPSSSSSSRRATSLTSIGASCARSKGSLSGCGSTSSPAVVRALGHRRGKGAPVARAANGGRRSGSRPGTHPRLAGDSHCAGERIAVVDHSFRASTFTARAGAAYLVARRPTQPAPLVGASLVAPASECDMAIWCSESHTAPRGAAPGQAGCRLVRPRAYDHTASLDPGQRFD